MGRQTTQACLLYWPGAAYHVGGWWTHDHDGLLDDPLGHHGLLLLACPTSHIHIHTHTSVSQSSTILHQHRSTSSSPAPLYDPSAKAMFVQVFERKVVGQATVLVEELLHELEGLGLELHHMTHTHMRRSAHPSSYCTPAPLSSASPVLLPSAPPPGLSHGPSPPSSPQTVVY